MGKKNGRTIKDRVKTIYIYMNIDEYFYLNLKFKKKKKYWMNEWTLCLKYKEENEIKQFEKMWTVRCFHCVAARDSWLAWNTVSRSLTLDATLCHVECCVYFRFCQSAINSNSRLTSRWSASPSTMQEIIYGFYCYGFDKIWRRLPNDTRKRRV